MTPYILDGRKRLPPESEPSPEQYYDVERQIWADRPSGRPVVELMASPCSQSQFGETMLTKTHEGADQSEVAALEASQFGETTITETREGADQREIVGVVMSQFGETTMTKSVEGADHEVTGLSQFGETTMTRTVEGADHEIIGQSQFGETTNTATLEGIDQPEVQIPMSTGNLIAGFSNLDCKRASD